MIGDIHQTSIQVLVIMLACTIPLTFLSNFYLIGVCYLREICMILTVGRIKGGSGKTTLAINISVARSLKKKEFFLLMLTIKNQQFFGLSRGPR